MTGSFLRFRLIRASIPVIADDTSRGTIKGEYWKIILSGAVSVFYWYPVDTGDVRHCGFYLKKEKDRLPVERILRKREIRANGWMGHCKKELGDHAILCSHPARMPSGTSLRTTLSPGSGREQCDKISVCKRCIEPGQKMGVI
jgi:hypothetical protein